MTALLSTLQPDFTARFDRIVDARRESDSAVAGQVTDILRTVKQRGD
ncbi:MAG: histidinol dehydrogenase, partial [Alphaproteobacteria bacterium HGW-Alphaproteobacteria-9]